MMKTIVEVDLLQQWDSHRLSNPAATLSGFLKGVEHAAAATCSMPVRKCDRLVVGWLVGLDDV
jgi:hypothetical protein